ncbi:permease [Klebsiella pneumoniae]|uniref:Permease n=1 Tax=Klebsiella pneumoniae TaxID=573 RepID=A0A377ZPA2_KLEPN|nr:permease [Klebsiella pneumoniae]
MTLNKAPALEGTAMLRDFRITDFNNYQAIIGHQAVSADPDDTEQMDMRHLVEKPTPTRARRTALALHAGGDRLHYGADGGAAQRGEPASGPRAVDAAGDLLYLVFFLLQTSIKSNGGKGKMDPLSGCGRLTCSILRWRCC